MTTVMIENEEWEEPEEPLLPTRPPGLPRELLDASDRFNEAKLGYENAVRDLRQAVRTAHEGGASIQSMANRLDLSYQTVRTYATGNRRARA